MWYGRSPRLNITKPEFIREIFAKYEVFTKRPPGKKTPFGLVMREGEDWAKVRRIINPAYDMEKLKNMLPTMEKCCDKMIRKWEEMVATTGSAKVDVYSSLNALSGDVIAETSFGSSYEEAGKDTTTSLLTWAMVLLSEHQDWQSKAREEVLSRFGKDKTPDYSDINSLTIVNMIINETLRFYPPVSSLSRIIHTNTKLKQLTLLNGMEVNMPTIMVHRDQELWGDDANEFNPNRFSEGVVNATKVPGSFIPFGGGPRICIGKNFALIEAKLALTKILQHFSFELSPSYVHAPMCLAAMVPQFGAPLILYQV
uniref:Cytochrome P450 n=1 Tax=Chenopodium quinoa TaxID=63459 RepID=A0A803MDE7_CHEQI